MLLYGALAVGSSGERERLVSAESASKPRLGVAGVIIRGGKFLLIKRSMRVIAPGAWCFVGGGVEPGEAPADAIVRECHEEIGAVVAPVREVWTYTRPDGGLVLHFWLVTWLNDTLTLNENEVSEVGWYTPDEMQALTPVLASNNEFLDAAGEALLSE